MQPYTRVTGITVPLDQSNIDTDQIIPAKFLKRIERSGFGEFLFYARRYMQDGSPNPKFVLNKPQYQGATILVAGSNFGSGSSREHAPWALLDYGFRTIIAPSFADIFRNNCYQNGMLPLDLPLESIAQIMKRANDITGYQVTVDLEQHLVTDQEGLSVQFEIDSFRRNCLLQGLDDIELTLAHKEAIAAYEHNKHPLKF
jgi:3-isopropylmalate/(R)-2-methylmalate dehydratase small subunit